MSIIERLENFKLNSKIDNNKLNSSISSNNYSELNKNICEEDYLNKPEFIDTINIALVELYKKQPSNPVEFLAKYLLNQVQAKKIKIDIDIMNKEKHNYILLYKKEKINKEEQNKKIMDEINIKENKKNNLLELIKNSKDLDNDLINICNTLKECTNSTGVYISNYDNKRRFVNKEEDENAHLLDYKVIRYIAFDNKSNFLKNQCLEPEEGITYNLIKVNDENIEYEQEGIKVNDNKLENNTGDQKSLDYLSKKLNFILEDEVIRNNKIKFFLEPKLGCYLAIEISYQSSLNIKSLESSIQLYYEYEQEKADIELKNKQKEENNNSENDEQEIDNKDISKDNNNNIEENINQDNELKATLKEFEKEEKKYIISLDTLGQDRSYNNDEKYFIFTVADTIINSWYNLERTLLLKDRDIKIEIKEKEIKYLEENSEKKLKDEEEKYYKEEYLFKKYEDNIPQLSEEEVHMNTILSSIEYYINLFINDKFFNSQLLHFNKLEFVYFEKIFQNILYFIGVDNTSINIEFTNKLDWKLARNYWNNNVFTLLKNYNPFGPKKEPCSYYALINRQYDIFQSFMYNFDPIKEHNYALSKLVEFIYTLITQRRDDIIKRKKYQYEYIENRDALISKKEDRERLKQDELGIAKENFEIEKAEKLASLENKENEEHDDKHEDVKENEEEPEYDEEGNIIKINSIDNEFNEEEWLRNWDADKSEIIIPEEIELDEDNDIEIDIKKIIEQERYGG